MVGSIISISFADFFFFLKNFVFVHIVNNSRLDNELLNFDITANLPMIFIFQSTKRFHCLIKMIGYMFVQELIW